MKSKLRDKAIKLRMLGRSYSEIQKDIKVSKSTLSFWLRDINLSPQFKQQLEVKRNLGAYRGALIQREKRIETENQITKKAVSQINKISKRDLWLIGISLYWAEGAKNKEYNISQGVIFSNSDALMHKIMIRWFTECLGVSKDQISFDIYLHETYKSSQPEIKLYWSLVTGFSQVQFDKIYWKKDKTTSKRRNKNSNYKGQLRIKIRNSTNLNRKISGWIKGILFYCGVV